MMLAFELTQELRSTAAASMWDCRCRVPTVAPPGPARPPTPTPTPTRRRLRVGVGAVPASRRPGSAGSESATRSRTAAQGARTRGHVSSYTTGSSRRQGSLLAAATAGCQWAIGAARTRRGRATLPSGFFASCGFSSSWCSVSLLTGSCLRQGLILWFPPPGARQLASC